NLAMKRVQTEPTSTMASPSEFPSGIGPAGLAPNMASRSFWDFPSRSLSFMDGVGFEFPATKRWRVPRPWHGPPGFWGAAVRFGVVERCGAGGSGNGLD